MINIENKNLFVISNGFDIRIYDKNKKNYVCSHTFHSINEIKDSNIKNHPCPICNESRLMNTITLNSNMFISAPPKKIDYEKFPSSITEFMSKEFKIDLSQSYMPDNIYEFFKAVQDRANFLDSTYIRSIYCIIKFVGKCEYIVKIYLTDIKLPEMPYEEERLFYLPGPEDKIKFLLKEEDYINIEKSRKMNNASLKLGISVPIYPLRFCQDISNDDISNDDVYILEFTEYVNGKTLYNILSQFSSTVKEDKYKSDTIGKLIKISKKLIEKKIIHGDMYPDNIIERENDKELILKDYTFRKKWKTGALDILFFLSFFDRFIYKFNDIFWVVNIYEKIYDFTETKIYMKSLLEEDEKYRTNVGNIKILIIKMIEYYKNNIGDESIAFIHLKIEKGEALLKFITDIRLIANKLIN
jgi:tRNA A-37 threonylcarbamoyl transferase component Bud32